MRPSGLGRNRSLDILTDTTWPSIVAVTIWGEEAKGVGDPKPVGGAPLNQLFSH
jgi:hypothetical protein